MRLALTLFSALLLSAGTTFALEDRIEKTFELKPGGNLKMEVDRGAIHIVGGDADNVQVKIVREARRSSAEQAQRLFDSHQIHFEEDGDTLTITAEQEKRVWKRFKNNNLRVQYTIALPKRFNLDVRTAGGEIRISDIEGKVEARTSGGHVEVENITGGMDLRTSGGHVRASQLKGDLTASTSGGHIEVDGVKGTVSAETSGGRVKLMGVDGPVDAKTSGGNITALFAAVPSGDSKLTTTGGSVKVTLPQDAAVDLRARCTGGRITSEFGGVTGSKLSKEVNGGGPTVAITTTGGNIEVRSN